MGMVSFLRAVSQMKCSLWKELLFMDLKIYSVPIYAEYRCCEHALRKLHKKAEEITSAFLHFRAISDII